MVFEKVPGMRVLHGSCSDEDILEFEKKIGMMLPDDFKDFLRSVNGVHFKDPISIKFDPTDEDFDDTAEISTIFGLPPSPDEFDIRQSGIAHGFKRRVPSHFLAIGEHISHNKLCLVVGGEKRGSVYYWCPDISWDELEEEQGPTTKHLRFVSESFTSFWMRFVMVKPKELSAGEDR